MMPPHINIHCLHVGEVTGFAISGWFKVGFGWLVNAYSSHSIQCKGDKGGL